MALSIRGLWPDRRSDVVKACREIDFALRIPRNAFPPLPSLSSSGPREVKRSGGRIVAFHGAIDGAVFGDQIAFALAPVKHLERLRQFAGNHAAAGPAPHRSLCQDGRRRPARRILAISL